MSKEFRTSVGGQALMEGIMMRGPEKICCAVRKPDGSIDLTYDTVTTRWYNKVPLVRGVCNMAENLYKGYKYLMHAADVAMEEETEPAESKLDKWFEEHAAPAVQNAMMTCAAFVGVALALLLFTFLPRFDWPRHASRAAGSLAARHPGRRTENGHLPWVYVPLHPLQGVAPCL